VSRRSRERGAPGGPGGAPSAARQVRPLVKPPGGERADPTAPELLDLQRSAGNAAVAGLLAQRETAGDGELPGLGPAGLGPAGAGTLTAHPVLRRGAEGEAVRELQSKLNGFGATPPLVVDGIFGPLTEGALKGFQRDHALGDDGVAGAQSWKALDAPPGPSGGGGGGGTPGGGPTPSSHPTLRLGDKGAEVGILQEKLNATVGFGLPVTGVFDDATERALVNFQFQNVSDPSVLMEALTNTGVAGPATWALLDKLAPGGGVVGGVETHVEHPGGGHPLGVPIGSLHPKVGLGFVSTGAAVEELQQKLNLHRAGIGLPQDVPVDGNFTPVTLGAVVVFQIAKGLPLTTVADDATWNALDADVGVGTVGFVERNWTEDVGGHHYTMTGASASRYSWRLSANAIDVTAKVNFLGSAPNPQWSSFVQATWNTFKAVEATSGNEMLISFHLVSGTGPEAHDVIVVPAPAKGRANAGQWFFADANAASTIPHEFGHLIGLRDEYQQSAADYTQVTGHEAYVGADTATDGASANTVATEQRNAITAKSSTQAFNSVTTHGVKEGAFAQQVVQDYKTQFSGDLVKDLDVNLPPDTGGPIPKYQTIQVFTYTSGTLMGDPSRHPDPHDHDVQPRHVMEFVEVIQKARGGTWTAVPR
jgi:peptidoglycan hydrolase-like protein with peptidoglycan-binding domain